MLVFGRVEAAFERFLTEIAVHRHQGSIRHKSILRCLLNFYKARLISIPSVDTLTGFGTIICPIHEGGRLHVLRIEVGIELLGRALGSAVTTYEFL